MPRDIPLDLPKESKGNLEIPRRAVGRDPVPMVGSKNELRERSPVAGDGFGVLRDDEILRIRVLPTLRLGISQIEGRSESPIRVFIDQTKIEHSKHEGLLAHRILARQGAKLRIVLPKIRVR